MHAVTNQVRLKISSCRVCPWGKPFQDFCRVFLEVKICTFIVKGTLRLRKYVENFRFELNVKVTAAGLLSTKFAYS
jgi:hypothetical protein